MVIYYDSSMFEETKPGLYITTEAYYNDVLNSLSPDDLKFIKGLGSKQEKMFYISYYDSKGATIHTNALYLVSDSEGRYQYRLENGKYVKSNTINKSSISVPLLSFDLDYKHGASAFSETYEDNENDLKEKQIEYNGQKVTSTDLIINSIDFSVKSAKGDYVTPSIDDIYKIIERSNNDQKKFFSIFIDVVKKANEHEAAIVDDEKHYFWFKTLLTTLLALFLLYKRCFISRPEEELAPKPTL